MASQGASVRFWIEEYAFGEGETALLREQIEVEWLQLDLALLCQTSLANIIMSFRRALEDVHQSLARR